VSIDVNTVIDDLETGLQYLVLWVAPTREFGYWHNLSGVSRVPALFFLKITEQNLENGLYEASVFSSEDIQRPEETLTDKERTARDIQWSRIQNAVELEPDIYESSSRTAILRTIAKQYNLKVNNLYYLLDKYWRSGKSKNAFIPAYFKCGAKGTQRAVYNKRQSSQFGTGTVGGKVLSHADRSNFEKVIRSYYFTQERRSLKSTYEKLLEKYYTQKSALGELKLLEASQRPSFRQFQYWYYKNRDIVSEKKKRDGEREFELKSRAVLGRSDFGLMGPGAQYQVDATVGDVYLVSQFDRNAIVGRPIIYFILDAFSRMVVGMSVGLEGPSWSALAAAIINLATDKVAFCKEYDIEISEDMWPCYHIPSSLLGDRGELESKNADSLVNIFGMRIINAPPYRCDLKGIIEQHFRTINANGIKQLPGSVKPGMSKRGGHDYRLDATLDIKQLTQILIKCVLHYNNYHYMSSFEKNEAMMLSDVNAVPIKLWEWGIQNYSGALRPFLEDVVKFAVLPTEKATVTSRGIRFKGLFYSCGIAIAENWFERARSTKTWSVKVSYDSRDMKNIYIWNADTKRYEACFLLDWNSKYAGKTLTEIVFEQKKEQIAGRQLKDSEIESKVNLNADIDAIVANAKDMGKSAPAKSKSERVSQIRENRTTEREAIRNGDNTPPQALSTAPAISQRNPNAEDEVSPRLRMIKAKLEERLKNDGAKSDL
jgi:hypothetical protein